MIDERAEWEGGPPDDDCLHEWVLVTSEPRKRYKCHACGMNKIVMRKHLYWCRKMINPGDVCDCGGV